MKTRKHLLCFLAVFCAAVAASGTFTIEPAVVTLNAATGEKTATLEVAETGGNPIAVKLTVFERVLDLDGELDGKAQTICNDFQIYPSEIILRPEERRNVQLRYIGAKNITADKAYTLFSKEVLLPVGEDEKEDVNIVVPTVVSYYTVVSLETGKEGKLTFVSSKAISGGMVEVIAENRSEGRVSTRNLAIKTSNDIIKGFTGTKNSIMPGQKRRFTFKYLRPLTSKEVKFIYD